MEVRYWERSVESVRDQIAHEEAGQQEAQLKFERALEPLHNEVARLNAIIERLEIRLARLKTADHPLTDAELDAEYHDERIESAAFWAEWQHERESSTRQSLRSSRRRRKSEGSLRRLYRAVARMIHPDLAKNDADRARREVAMRIANIAFEAHDSEQLTRLFEIWSLPEINAAGHTSVEDLRILVHQRQSEFDALQRRLKSAERSHAGRLARCSDRELQQRIDRERERMRRAIASLRLRRRRLLRFVNARREELTEISD